MADTPDRQTDDGLIAEQSIERQMGISRRDFFRLLPKAVQHYHWEKIGDDTIKILLPETAGSDGEITISLSAQSEYKIGSLCLPVIGIHFHIKNVVKKTKESFFQRFDISYQRGGG